MAAWRLVARDGDDAGQSELRFKYRRIFREHIELPFFIKNLKDKEEEKFREIQAWVFETGTNQWRRFDTWPPEKATRRSLYFAAGGKL